jgi:hypothetical protein
METKKALEILKTALDLATGNGVFKKIEDSAIIIQAFNVIAEKLQKSEEHNAITN